MKRALVLSGGGARGAYQVGVWKALEELNIKCDIVTGVSVGSINAALYSEGELQKSIELWEKLNLETVFPIDTLPNNKELIKIYRKSLKNGGIEPSNLRKNLEKCINPEKVYNSNIEYGLITVKLLKKKKNKLPPRLFKEELTLPEIKKEEFIDYIIASCTMFPFFKIKEIENNKYIDGGYKNPVPYELAKSLGGEEIIVVNISVLGKRKIIPKNKNTIVITPHNKIGTPIIFDGNQSKKNIQYGYNDTMKVYNKLYGNKYTFKNIDKYYKKDKYFKTIKDYINIIEFLGKIFKLDDSKIYTLKEFNNYIYNEIEKISINSKKKRITRKERITIIYNNLLNNKLKRINLKREYLSAYYLYINKSK